MNYLRLDKPYSVFTMDVNSGELDYKKITPDPRTKTALLVSLAVSLLIWPLMALIGILSGIIKYKYNLDNEKQDQIVSWLNNDDELQKYINRRLEKQAKKENNIKGKLLIFLAKGRDEGILLPELRTAQDWDDFLQLDIAKNFPADKKNKQQILHEIEIDQLRLKRLLKEKDELNGLNKLEVIKQIAKLAFIKRSFQKAEAWPTFKCSVCFIVPFLSMWYDIKKELDPQLLYEGKKDLLAKLPELDTYADLVEAHNQLVSQYDYLMPFHKYLSPERPRFADGKVEVR